MNKVKKAGIIILVLGLLFLALSITFLFTDIDGGNYMLIGSVVINIVGLNLLTYRKK